jgi:hypothetical protein
MAGSKLANDQRPQLSATKLWNDFHYINSFAEVKGEHNQYWRYLSQKVPMKLSEFNELVSNNRGNLSTGEEYMIEKLIWSPFNQTAEIDYRIKKKYTNNLKVEYVE